MAAAPNSSALEKALQRLLEREPGWKHFVRPEAKGARPAAVGTGVPADGGAQGGGVFDEADAALRTYYPARTLTSTDGLFTFRIEPIKSLRLTSGHNATFKDPA
ncbi:hypothetical protein [Thauera butanivorans]|uniref:hypothetical protein n=1 Tax=Thauera butanivorans TaxID=86174 RepID=UPI000838B232|nr:hypothetical protein [Thauera butanivorans]